MNITFLLSCQIYLITLTDFSAKLQATPHSQTLFWLKHELVESFDTFTFLLPGGEFYIFVRMSNQRVCRQTSWARYIHKHVTFPVKSCQTNLYRGEREYLDSNVFLHGSCTSYKSCNGETTKISPSLLFEHERRRRSFLCEYKMWDWWRFRNEVWQNNALIKKYIFWEFSPNG